MHPEPGSAERLAEFLEFLVAYPPEAAVKGFHDDVGAKDCIRSFPESAPTASGRIFVSPGVPDTVGAQGFRYRRSITDQQHYVGRS